MTKKYSKSLIFEELEPRLLFSADIGEALAVAAIEQDIVEPPVIVIENEFESEVEVERSPVDQSKEEAASADPASTEETAATEDIDKQETSTDPKNEKKTETETTKKDTGVTSVTENTTSDIIGESATSETTSTKELVIINPSVYEYDQLIPGLEDADTRDRNFEVIILDTERDGLEQINYALSEYSDLDAIHFISHGTNGMIKLGNLWLNDSNLQENSDSISAWGDSLSNNGDILFYGCDIAAGSYGEKLLETISKLTGADVAASEDATGHEDLGGNWELEFATGSIEAEVAIDATQQNNWNTLLDVITVNTFNDWSDGGDTSSIANLKLTPGSDGISLREAIIAANNDDGIADEILLGAGTYTLDITGKGEDLAATGDLDITDDLTITGVGAGATTIDAADIDRVFDLFGAINVNMSGLTIQRGYIDDDGGGINSPAATLNLTSVAIKDNWVSKKGGGIYNDGDLTLNRVTISGNHTSGEGGGIYHDSDNLSLTNVTVSGNDADDDGGGLELRGDATLQNVTITANHANSKGGGLNVQSGTATLHNTIVAGNTASDGPDVKDDVVSDGSNIIQDDTDSSGFMAPEIGVNPLLDPTLTDNGGSTFTHALLAGSPAIDSGTATGAPATDQRGYMRDGAVDIGAYEVSLSSVPTATDDNYITGHDTPLVVGGGSGLLTNDGDSDGDTLTTEIIDGPNNGVLTINPLAIGTVTNLTNDGDVVADSQAVWSPDGSKIAFSRVNGGAKQVFVMNADGTGMTQLTSGGVVVNHQVAWSPDGSQLAITSMRYGNDDIIIIDATNGDEIRQLTSNSNTDHTAAWSPDGTKIVFSSNRSGDFEIWVTNADGTGSPSQLTSASGVDRSPEWSPDGSKILFRSTRDLNENIYVINADGTGSPSQLTTDLGPDTRATWSPDGSRIAFISDRGENNDIFVMDADGTNQLSLGSTAAFEQQVDWSPDGTQLLINADNDDIYVLGLLFDGTFTYTPESGFSGNDTFSYIASDGSNNSGVATATITVNDAPTATHAISGTIFEDINADGDILDDGTGSAGVNVDLYIDDGTVAGEIDASDSLVTSDTTDGSGNYSFTGLSDATYWVIVDSTTIDPNAGFNGVFSSGDAWAEQTYGVAGSVSFASSYSYTASAGAFYGGMRSEISDNAGALTTAEHATRVMVSGSDVSSVDTGFSFNVITNTGDDGAASGPSIQGSLRQFIFNSNAIDNTLHGPNTSQFAIPTTDSNYNSSGNGEFTITPTAALPIISDAVVLDGTTQAGYSGTPIIELDGTSAGSNVSGLNLFGGSDGSTIRGLVINRFKGHGIEILGNDNHIELSYIGTDVAGNADLGNEMLGIRIVDAIGNYIGGSGVGNIISGNDYSGVAIVGSASDGNFIQGNLIGTNAAGAGAVGNDECGIDIWSGGPSNTTIGGISSDLRNVISGNDWDGIHISGFMATGNLVMGNYIGTDITGTAGISNNGGGVLINGGADNNIIGGTADGSGNLIAHNNGHGVLVDGATTDGNSILENEIYNSGTGIVHSSSGNNNRLDPTLSTVTTDGAGSITITGAYSDATLVNDPTVIIDFFSNPGDTQEGRTYLGSGTFSTNGSGIGVINSTLSATVAGGQYITATVTDSAGNTSEFSETEMASVASNADPTADAGTYTIAEGDSITLDGSNSSDPDGDTLSYAWDLNNDGSYDNATGENPTVNWETLQTYGIDDDGTHTIGLQVDDGKGGIATTSTTLTVNNTTPTLSVTGDTTVAAGAIFTLNLSVTDPGNDTISGWTINWGDGTIEDVAGNPPSVTHTYNNAGFTNNIIVSATDEDNVNNYIHSDLLVGHYKDNSGFYVIQGTWGDAPVEFGDDGTLNKVIQPIVGPDGNIYVSGESSGNVLRYNATTGAFIDEFATLGGGDAGGLTFGPDGNLYVADYTNREIVQFDGSDGSLLGSFVTGIGGRPYGIIFGPDSNLYVNTYDTAAVFKYDGDTGDSLGTFVAPGAGDLDTPEQMVFGPDGNLYIADVANNSILRFSGTDGTPMGVFIPDTEPNLDKPNGLAFGPDGNLYVSDAQDGVILRFNGTTGAFIDEYVSGLDAPSLIAFIPDHQVLVLATNTAPTTTSITDITVDEDAVDTVIDLFAAFEDAEDSDSALTYIITANTNSDLFTATTIDDGLGTLNLDYALDKNGSTDITVRATDSGGLYVESTFTVTVNPVNDAPIITGTFVGTVAEDGTLTDSAALTITDADTIDNPISFDDVAATAGDNGYGDFVMAGNSWTYILDNTNVAVQALDAGQSLTDTYTFLASDTITSQTVTVTINGAEDAPYVTGTFVGTVAEDGTLTDSAALTITDADTIDNPISFDDVVATAGDNGYGDFVMAGNSWTYILDNTSVAVQALDAGQSLTDTYTFLASDTITSQTVTVTINGAEDAPYVTGIVVGTVAEDGTLTDSAALTITDADTIDNPISFDDVVATAGDNGYGDFVMAGNSWTYILDNTSVAVQALDAGQSLTDTYTFLASDAITTQTVTVTINGAEDAPYVTGTVVGTVAEDGMLTDGAALNITDADTIDNPISFDDVVATAGDNDYGDFVMAANSWTYTLDNNNADVQALDAGQSLTDTYTFWASDAITSQIVTVTINGTEDAPSLDNTIADQTATEDVLFGFTFAANTFSDLDSTDNLIYTATLADDSPLPSWIGFDGNTRTFSGTPTNSDGTINVKVTADDGTSTVSDIFNISVNNTPTAIDDTAETTPDSPFTTSNVFDNDDLGDAPTTILTFDATSGSGGTIIYNDDGTFTYTPVAGFTGDDTFSYTITDGDGDTSSAIVTVIVQPLEDTPAEPGEAIGPEETENTQPDSMEPAPKDTPAEEDPTTKQPVVDEEYVEPVSSEAMLENSLETVPVTIHTDDDTSDRDTGDKLDTSLSEIVVEGSSEISATQPIADTADQVSTSKEIRTSPSAARESAVHDKSPLKKSFTTQLLQMYMDRLQFNSEFEYNQAMTYLENALDDFKEEAGDDFNYYKTVVGSAIAVSTGLSVGYVVWLIRGGMLLSSVLFSMPAWQIADPLPLLVGGKDDEDDEDGETLETIIKTGSAAAKEKASKIEKGVNLEH